MEKKTKTSASFALTMIVGMELDALSLRESAYAGCFAPKKSVSRYALSIAARALARAHEI
jgi:hypothetical protein